MKKKMVKRDTKSKKFGIYIYFWLTDMALLENEVFHCCWSL